LKTDLLTFQTRLWSYIYNPKPILRNLFGLKKIIFGPVCSQSIFLYIPVCG
jgi:hypothetical protein